MAVIDKTTVSGITTRLGAQYALLDTAFTTANAITGTYWSRITATADPDVISDLMSSAYNAETIFTVSNYANKSLSVLKTIIIDLEKHMATYDYISLDDYLTAQTSTVSADFAELYALIASTSASVISPANIA